MIWQFDEFILIYHVVYIFYPNCSVLFQFALVHPDFHSVDVEIHKISVDYTQIFPTCQVKALEVPMDLVEVFLAKGDPKPTLLQIL